MKICRSNGCYKHIKDVEEEVATGETAYLYWDPFSDPDEDYMETRSFMWIEKEVFDSYMGNMMPE